MTDNFFRAAYTGTKQFTQQQVSSANATGFGAAADDFMERGIDLNEQLIFNKPATFFFKMNGNAMLQANILPGDILIVDRSIKVATGKIIVAAVNDDLVVRRFEQSFNKAKLCAANFKYRDIELDEFTSFSCWGVVTCVIHLMEPGLVNFSKK